jgi:nitrogen fixation protein FixH
MNSKFQIPNSKSFNPWPAALTVIVVGAFAFAAFVAVTMIRQPVDLVVKDYYEQDLKHSERMAREARAKALDQPLRVAWRADAKTLRLEFPDPSATGVIELYRPSDSALDRRVEIQPDASGLQEVPGDGLAAGLWRVHVAWQQGGEDFYQAESFLLR